MSRKPSMGLLWQPAWCWLAAVLAGAAALAADGSQPQPGGTNGVVKAPTNAPAVTSTNAAPAAPESSAPTALDYSAFRMIADRNIFNANRSSRTARSGERARQPVVETFSVVGTMSYAKGDLAFFDGSSGSFRKTLKVGETIAGHKVTAITTEEVSLEAGDKKVTLKVGGQMRREDEGPWEMATAGVSHNVVSAATTAGGSADSASGGDVSDALKRLLQKREQELKNENQ